MSNSSRLLLRLVTLLSHLPLPLCRGLGRVTGHLLYWLPNRNRATTRINLDLAFPEWSPAQRRQLARRSLVESATTFLEMPSIWLGEPEVWRQRIDCGACVTTMQQLLAEGRGLILAVPHLGNWEVGVHILTQVAPLKVLYRPPRQAELEALIVAGRSSSGATMVPATPSGVRALLQALRKGEMVTILPDQEPKAGGKEAGVFAPFFTTPASTMVLLNRLAHKTGAPVLYLYALRTKGKPGFRLHAMRGDAALADADALVAATALNQGVEQCVRHCPEQYQWSYRRWRSRPDGGPSRYG